MSLSTLLHGVEASRLADCGTYEGMDTFSSQTGYRVGLGRSEKNFRPRENTKPRWICWKASSGVS